MLPFWKLCRQTSIVGKDHLKQFRFDRTTGPMHVDDATVAMNTSIELRQLGHLVMLADELSFTRAAIRSNLSQAAFSRSIGSLEKRLGVRLFDRGTRSVRVTAAGHQIIERARGLIEKARDLAAEVDGLAQAGSGTLRFGITLMGVDSGVGDALPLLRQQNPNLTLRVEVGQWQLLLQQLRTEQIELFIGYPGLLARDPAFVVTPLVTVPASIFCRAGHPLSRERRPALRRIADYPWAFAQLPDAARARLRALLGMPRTAPLPVALDCSSQSLLRQAMLSSDALLLTWRSWLTDDLDSGAVIDLGERLHPTLPNDLTDVECAVIRMADQTPSPGAQKLLSLLASAKGTY